ncbi:MAG: hypothetical protein P1U77_16480 [Rubripirellula sp.]|nr:hypothetical protein [Rubripirellula sp.]
MKRGTDILEGLMKETASIPTNDGTLCETATSDQNIGKCHGSRPVGCPQTGRSVRVRLLSRARVDYRERT